jgi:hypothetical protein
MVVLSRPCHYVQAYSDACLDEFCIFSGRDPCMAFAHLHLQMMELICWVDPYQEQLATSSVVIVDDFHGPRHGGHTSP